MSGYQEKAVTLFNEPQQEQLKEIGAYLGQVRQEQSIRTI